MRLVAMSRRLTTKTNKKEKWTDSTGKKKKKGRDDQAKNAPVLGHAGVHIADNVNPDGRAEDAGQGHLRGGLTVLR